MNPCIVDFLQCWCRWKRKPTSEFWSHSPLTCGTSVFHAPFLFLCYFFILFYFLSCSTRHFWSTKRAFLHDSLYLHVTFWSQISFLLFLIFKRDPSCSVHHQPEPGFKQMGKIANRGVLANECMTTEDADNVNVAVGRTDWSCQREVSDYWKWRQSNQHGDLWLPLVAHECFFFFFCTAE